MYLLQGIIGEGGGLRKMRGLSRECGGKHILANMFAFGSLHLDYGGDDFAEP